MDAFQKAIQETSTVYAPWYVIPSNRNWYRDLVILSVITDALKKLKMKYPDPVDDIEQYIPQLLQK